uniref:Putative glycosyltransferase n=1 Tax=viral metagenome TaxID=1070528 RepID=A0A6M3IQP0_9ZZZZ
MQVGWPAHIPRTLHLYWGRNRPLTRLRYLTVATFLHYNPDWSVVVHTPAVNPAEIFFWPSSDHKYFTLAAGDRDHLEDLAHIARVTVLIEAHKFWDAMLLSEVHRADLLRWHVMAEYGGVWSDFDMLYVKSLESAVTSNGRADIYLCDDVNHTGDKYYCTSFVASAGNDRSRAFYSSVLREAVHRTTGTSRHSAGREPLAVVASDPPDECCVSILPGQMFYPVPEMYSTRLYADTDVPVSDLTIGIHWFGGSRCAVEFESRAAKKVCAMSAIVEDAEAALGAGVTP